MLKRLVKLLKQMGASKESDTDRGGAFSYSGETHGFAVGVYYGFVDFRDWGGLPDGYADGKNIERGWYPKFGYLVGAIVRVLLYLLAGGLLLGGLELPVAVGA